MPKKIYRKVLSKDRLPKNTGEYFVKFIDEDGDQLLSTWHFSPLSRPKFKKQVIWWLEEVSIIKAMLT